MTPLKKIRICLCLNISLLLFISSCIIIFASDSIYFRYGPSNNFNYKFNSYNIFFKQIFYTFEHLKHLPSYFLKTSPI